MTTANERDFLNAEDENFEARQNGEDRTIADLEHTVIVSTRLIVETLYKVRN